MNDSIIEKKKNWQQSTLEPILKKSGEQKKQFQTDSGIEVERLALPQELAYESQLGFP